MSRRNFVKTSVLTGIGTVLVSRSDATINSLSSLAKPSTNIADALKYTRNSKSLPGLFPGKVAEVFHSKSVVEKKISQEIVEEMLTKGMLELTGAKKIEKAWSMFVKPGEKIGLKVNPVAGKDLSTSLEIVKAVIGQLVRCGIQKSDILIWDRREFEMHEVGFTEQNFPGIKIIGTECKDEQGSFVDANGKLYGEERIDKNWFYWADVEGKYDAETLPYMVNEGKNSYFSKICTEMVDKIINIPILKNAGASVTLCLKNLAYGAVSNTGRLHEQLWADTCAEVCAFPPIRDKVVLNILDGFIGCYQGGPAANLQFITNFNTLLIGTDPVAVDRVGYEIIFKKRVEENIQKEESPRGRTFLEMAEKLELGVADIKKLTTGKSN
ncbi:MAG: DUF362 domain-containing protein [Bacteroidales bacterium]|nr:DUF362 domain-containing protein [Bacteroidales bacterium]